MLSILSRYLLQGYLKVFCLSICTFVSVLVVSRFKEIARFAALSGNWLKTGLFILYQIPVILPLAVPISALVSSFLLFQRLSRSYELVALRASGLSFYSLVSPLLVVAVFLSCFHFSFCAEIAPYCWRESKALLYRETSVNPLLLMQRQNLVMIKHAYLKMDVKKEGKEAADCILIAHNASNQRLNLFSASCLKVSGSKLLGYGLSMLSHLGSKNENTFDPLYLENQAEMSTETPVLSAALKKNRPKLDRNSFSLRMLRIQSHSSGKQALTAAIEIWRRSSLCLAVVTFTILGIAFGMQTSRTPSKRGLLWTFFLGLPLFMSYVGLKAIKTHPLLAFFSAFLPHVIIALCSLFRIWSVSRGRT